MIQSVNQASKSKLDIDLKSQVDYDRRHVAALEKVMDTNYEAIKEKVAIGEVIDSSDSDNENEQAFRELRPGVKYTLKDIAMNKVKEKPRNTSN